jgi:hypothetical protein
MGIVDYLTLYMQRKQEVGEYWVCFADGFLFPVKELGLLTNLGHWVRVLDVDGSYMYIVL